ncbi:fat-like cadherin-related tumor suppressor homolog [Saccostrea cucullata]|uniref:fat-like cadherin-related tumor suppressor homolog n=1 Tax=Saccostrea cuccullata TaxID=36930 RepID=UPI002ED1982A
MHRNYRLEEAGSTVYSISCVTSNILLQEQYLLNIQMLDHDAFYVLFTAFLLNGHILTVNSQEPCSSPDPNIAGTVYESTFSSFDSNSPLYRTDTTIEGINQGTQTTSGVNITFLRTQATPADLDLNNLFELITLPVSNSTFGSRTFIRLKSAIDRDGSSYTESDDLNNIEFQLSCRALKDPTQTKFFLMQLEIRDINDNAPIFRNTSYFASVIQSAPVGTTVYSGVTATDLDAGSNKEIEYAIVQGNETFPVQYFEVEKTSGKVILKQALCATTSSQFQFSVLARDKGNPPQFSVDHATVRITVYRNLFPPVFQGTPYTATINFNSVSGTTVKQVNATDADAQSPHNVVTYSIIGDATAQTLFSINAVSGLITTRQSLFNNNVESSSIFIEAKDGAIPSLSAISIVIVTISRNLNPPEWVSTSYTVNITETQDLEITISNMNTRDADTKSPYNTRITTLTGDADMLQFFRLTEDGRLSVQRSLTLSTKRTFIVKQK